MTGGALSPSDLAPRRGPGTVTALILALVAFAPTIPALMIEFRIISNWWWTVFGWWFAAAPLFGITSLVIAHQASREIKRSWGALTGRDLVVAAKAVAWLSAVAWTAGLMGAIVGPFSAQYIPPPSPS